MQLVIEELTEQHCKFGNDFRYFTKWVTKPLTTLTKKITLHLSRRKLRFASGVVLFTYIAVHFFNHALGLISMAFAEQGLRVAVMFWHSLVGTVVLYGAAGIHIALAFIAIYQHRTLRLPVLEWVRIGAGLSIPTLLIRHAVDTRLAFEVYGRPTDYAHIVWMLWNSGNSGRQIALLVPGWIHGCLGLRFALSSRNWYPQLRFPLFGAALLLPVLAVLGFFSMLKEVAVLAQDPSWIAVTVGPVGGTQHAPLLVLRNGLLIIYCCAIAAVFAARALRAHVEERRGSLVTISYPIRAVKVPRGWTVLEASHAHHIDHVSMCGGRARCSTCRVHVLSGLDRCLQPTEDERRTLQRIQAPDGTRLACQLRPLGDISVIPLVSHAAHARQNARYNIVDRNLCIFIVDVRWGNIQRTQLSYDMLHASNRFCEEVGKAARAAGGDPIQFAGDRVTVLFTLESSEAKNSRRALRAAAELDVRLQELSLQLQHEIGCSMEHIICIHFGSAIAGETGDRKNKVMTVIGSAVDVARQIIETEKMLTVQVAGPVKDRIIVSSVVLAAVQRDSEFLKWSEVKLGDGNRVEFGRFNSLRATELAADS